MFLSAPKALTSSPASPSYKLEESSGRMMIFTAVSSGDYAENSYPKRQQCPIYFACGAEKHLLPSDYTPPSLQLKCLERGLGPYLQ